MIVVRITMNVIPEKQKEVVQTLLSMTGPMEKALGCLSYPHCCKNLRRSAFVIARVKP
jgi:quinol monooxygenase YgiN